ncbi:CU044_5270 family protein [Nonomuraea sp. NPDC049725]|uniref:CU044_5270 family protein n=1 Tax=Nonomuraea sp. NPDC049725 TaxID=3154508 RepID=UPI0034449508
MNNDEIFKGRARVLDEELAGRVSTPGADALLAEVVSLERVPEQRRRRLRAPGRALLGVAAAAVAAGVVVPAMLSGGTISVVPQPGESQPGAFHPGESQPGMPQPSASLSAPAGGSTAQQILLAAAVATERAPASGDYWRTTTVSRWMLPDPTRGYMLEGSRSLETWLAVRPELRSWRIRQDLGVKPATARDEQAWRAAGAPASWRYTEDMRTDNLFSVPSRPLRTAAGERSAERLYGKWKGTAGHLIGGPLTWKQVRALPSDPGKLRSYLEEGIGRLDLAGSGMDVKEARAHILLRDCVEIISQLPASPEVRASAYRILASLPGIRAEGEVTDPQGRRGQALGYREEIEPGVFARVQLVVDPGSGLLLAEVRRHTTDLADGRQVELRHSTSFQAIGWTDERPGLPARRD